MSFNVFHSYDITLYNVIKVSDYKGARELRGESAKEEIIKTPYLNEDGWRFQWMASFENIQF